MNLIKVMELLKKYGICQECGSDVTGKGQGKLMTDENTFLRTCKCGWEVKIYDGEVNQ